MLPECGATLLWFEYAKAAPTSVLHSTWTGAPCSVIAVNFSTSENPFLVPNQKQILAAFTCGAPWVVLVACMHPKRLPLAQKYCTYRWNPWLKNSTPDALPCYAARGISRNIDTQQLKYSSYLASKRTPIRNVRANHIALPFPYTL